MKDIKTADEFREAANKHADMLTKVYEATKAERDAATFHLNNMQNNRDSLWTENQRLVEQRDAAQHSLSNAINDRDFVMEQLATARAVAKTGEDKINDLRSKLSHQYNESEALRKTLLAVCQERDDLRTTAKAIAERRDELQALISTHTKKYADLQSYVDEVVTARNTFNRQLQEMAIERTNLRTEVNKLQNLHTNQRETILQLQAAAGERAKPTQQEYLRHELMDRASVMCNIFDSMVTEHPALDMSEGCFDEADGKKLTEMVDTAGDAVAAIYQFIGDKHL